MISDSSLPPVFSYRLLYIIYSLDKKIFLLPSSQIFSKTHFIISIFLSFYFFYKKLKIQSLTNSYLPTSLSQLALYLPVFHHRILQPPKDPPTGLWKISLSAILMQKDVCLGLVPNNSQSVLPVQDPLTTLFTNPSPRIPQISKTQGTSLLPPILFSILIFYLRSECLSA